jgi:uncharacterized alpha-E superfamily protein
LTKLLSSHAESLFLLARRIERAESLARLIEVNASLQCPDQTEIATDANLNWAWIVSLYEDEKAFYGHFSTATPYAIGKFYICCEESPRSVHTAIRKARESVRSLRLLISAEISQRLAEFEDWLRTLDEADFSYERIITTCDAVMRQCQALQGAMEGSFYRDEAWAFFCLGRHIERAQQTSKLLDAAFAHQASSAANQELDYDFRLWTTLLRSTSAYGAFRRLNPGGLEVDAAARFLVFDRRLPRSVATCMSEIQRLINQLRTTFQLRNAVRAARRIDEIIEELDAAKRDAGLPTRLHEFNNWTQSRLNALTAELAESFFRSPQTVERAKEHRLSL